MQFPYVKTFQENIFKNKTQIRHRFNLNFPTKCSLLNKHISLDPFQRCNKYAQVPAIRKFVSNLNLHF